MNDCIYTFDSQPSLNYGQIFFITIGILPFLLCIPPLIMSKLVWEPLKKDGEKAYKLFKDQMKEAKKNIPYEYKYPVVPDLDNKVKISNIILEKTPAGYVAMRYNEDEEGFEYWTDHIISYKYLETVARKYVNTFFCTKVYIDRSQCLKEKIMKLTKDIQDNIAAKKELESEENGSEDEEEDEDVFADLKKYNKNIKTKKEEREKLTRDDYVCDVANKYIKKGQLADNKEWLKGETVANNTKSKMSWLSWKSTTDV